jgi:RNA polymerase sigma-70 factor, ECF subfamily
VAAKAIADAELRFREVFAHLPAVVAYARRRGCEDPEGVGSEVLSVAWRKLADVPRDDPRPWLYATARNVVLAEWRKAARARVADSGRELREESEPEVTSLDPELTRALSALAPRDREALLLVAWEDLTPALAARSLGISQPAFRVRLHRARTRLRRLLETEASAATLSRLEVE